MYTHAEKPQEKKQDIGPAPYKKHGVNESTFQLVDKRPQAIAQKKLIDWMNNSPKIKQLKAFQDMINHSPKVKQTALLQNKLFKHSSHQQPVIQKTANNTGLPDHIKSGSDNLLTDRQTKPLQQSQFSPFSPLLQQKVTQPVVQGAFIYNSERITTAERASALARLLYERIRASLENPQLTLKMDQFIQTVEELAVSGEYGSLDDHYFAELIRNGRIPESFSFQVHGRRVETVHNPSANFPPQRSFFHQHLASAARADLSYTDLRKILEQVLQGGVTPEEIDTAIQIGVERLNAESEQVDLDPTHHPDLQLLVHHLLRYQRFNRGLLRDTPENQEENSFRHLLTEMSKEIILRTHRRLERLVPRIPDASRGGELPDAMPALIDVNRPLSHSVFGEETYKAVYKLMHKLLRIAYDRVQRRGQSGAVAAVPLDLMRQEMNPALFELLPAMDASTIPEGEGQAFVTEHLRLPYDDETGSFVDDSSDSSYDPSTDEELYDSGDDLLRASAKRSTTLNSMGLFAKMTAQKELLDPDDEANQEKFRRLHKRIKRKRTHIDYKYGERYQSISKEMAYLKQKENAILNKIEEIESEIERINEQIERSPKDQNQKLLSRRRHLTDSLLRARQMYEKFSEFYFTTPVSDVVEGRVQDPRNWRQQLNPIFSQLGEQGMRRYIHHPLASSQDMAREEEQTNPQPLMPIGRDRGLLDDDRESDVTNVLHQSILSQQSVQDFLRRKGGEIHHTSGEGNECFIQSFRAYSEQARAALGSLQGQMIDIGDMGSDFRGDTARIISELLTRYDLSAFIWTPDGMIPTPLGTGRNVVHIFFFGAHFSAYTPK